MALLLKTKFVDLVVDFMVCFLKNSIGKKGISSNFLTWEGPFLIASQ